VTIRLTAFHKRPFCKYFTFFSCCFVNKIRFAVSGVCSGNGKIHAKRVLVIKFCSFFYCKTYLTKLFSTDKCSLFVRFGCDSCQWARASSLTRFLDHTQRRTTVGRTPLDEWSPRRRDPYLTTHNRQTSMPRRDSNPQSQHASGRRPTPLVKVRVAPYTAVLLRRRIRPITDEETKLC